ncbi:hypothetical protein C0J52_25274 [Blattella germanica]|nr:hypothetical protein C0J52_25274 [Blattella germanica]
MQESCKKPDEDPEMDPIGSTAYTLNDIDVDSVSMKDTGTSKKQDSDNESIASQVNRFNRDQMLLAETRSLMYPDEGIITDLDDISVNQKDFTNSILSFSNKPEPMIEQKKAGFKFGRRIPMGSFQLITSIACLTISAISVIPKEDTPWIDHLQTVLALLGKTCGICAFATMFLYTSELFPTVLRAVAMGHCGFWARIGSLLAPQLLFLGEHTIPAVPLIIIGIMGLLAGCSVFALPETLGQQLPDTIEDAELLAYSKKKTTT